MTDVLISAFVAIDLVALAAIVGYVASHIFEVHPHHHHHHHQPRLHGRF